MKWMGWFADGVIRVGAIRLGILVGVLAWIVLGMGGACSTAQAQLQFSLDELSVSEVRFQGNRTIASSKIQAKIKTRAGRPLEPRQLEADLKTLQETGWFSRVRVSQELGRDGRTASVIFSVVEMPMIVALEFRGNSAIKTKKLKETAGLEVGGRADHLRAEMARQQIARVYREEGFDQAEVRLLSGARPGDTTVIFQIFEGDRATIRGIGFEGNTFVSNAVLQTKLTSKPALLSRLRLFSFGRYDPEIIEFDRRALIEYYQQHGFLNVEVGVRLDRGDSLGDIWIRYVISEGVQFKVRQVRFEGNTAIADQELIAPLKLHSGEVYSDALRDLDRETILKSYYRRGRAYTQVMVEPAFTDQQGVIDLVYRIQESEVFYVGELIVRGNDRTKDRVLRQQAVQSGLLPGEIFDRTRVDLYKGRLQRLGYFNVNPQRGAILDVRPINPRTGETPYAGPEAGSQQPFGSGPGSGSGVILTRGQDPGPERGPILPPPPEISDVIDGDGLSPLDDPSAPPIDFLDIPPPPEIPIDEFGMPDPGPPPRTIVPGLPDPGPALPDFPKIPIEEAEPPGFFPSLPGNNFNNPGPDLNEPFPQRSYLDLETNVEETPTGLFQFGFGASSSGGLSGRFVYHQSNFDLFNVPRSFDDVLNGRAFTGAGQDLRIELSPGTLINRFLISFREPFLFNQPIGFNTSGYLFSRVYPDFTEERGGGLFAIGRQLGTQVYSDLAVRVENVHFGGFTWPAPADFLVASGDNFLLSLKPSLRFDNRNDPLAPSKGQYVDLSFEQVFGDFNYSKFNLEARQYFRLGSRRDGSGERTLTLRGFFGVTGEDTPVFERYFAGDFRSIRGFAFRGVGPRVLDRNVGGLFILLTSLEYQFPITANDLLQGVVFTDAGTVESGYEINDYRVSVGAGLRIFVPQVFGPLPVALDLAFPVNSLAGDEERAFNFTFGVRR